MTSVGVRSNPSHFDLQVLVLGLITDSDQDADCLLDELVDGEIVELELLDLGLGGLTVLACGPGFVFVCKTGRFNKVDLGSLLKR